MGGSIEMFEEQEQIERVSRGISKVNYCVRFADLGNWELLGRDKIYEKICGETDSYFEEMGVDHALVEVESGGGGLETFREIVMQLWQNRDLIAFIVSLGRQFKSVYRAFVNNKVKNMKPRLDFSFWLESDDKVDKLDTPLLGDVISRRYTNLLTISNNLINKLHDSYPFIGLDYSVGVRLLHIRFSMTIAVPGYKRDESTINRFLSLIMNMKIKKHTFTDYRINGIGIIMKSESRAVEKNDSFELLKPVNRIVIH